VTQLIAIGEIIQDLMIIHIVMNALFAHFENFIQFMTIQNNLPSFEKHVGKLFLEKQRREVKFGKQRNDEALFFQTRQNLGNNKKNYNQAGGCSQQMMNQIVAMRCMCQINIKNHQQYVNVTNFAKAKTA
jgi:hypothetical protein